MLHLNFGTESWTRRQRTFRAAELSLSRDQREVQKCRSAFRRCPLAYPFGLLKAFRRSARPVYRRTQSSRDNSGSNIAMNSSSIVPRLTDAKIKSHLEASLPGGWLTF